MSFLIRFPVKLLPVTMHSLTFVALANKGLDWFEFQEWASTIPGISKSYFYPVFIAWVIICDVLFGRYLKKIFRCEDGRVINAKAGWSYFAALFIPNFVIGNLLAIPNTIIQVVYTGMEHLEGEFVEVIVCLCCRLLLYYSSTVYLNNLKVGMR